MPRRPLLQLPKRLKGRAPAKDIARFMKYVDIQKDGCWLWTGYVDSNAYAQFWFHGQARGAHRVAWIIFRGALRDGIEIDHKHETCPHNCVCPCHLRKLTHSQNSHDGAYRRHNGKVDSSEIPI